MSVPSGKVAYVKFGAASFGFDEYVLNVDGENPDVSCFGAGGGVKRIDGVTDNTCDFSGPYDRGNMPLVRGAEYTITIGYAVGQEASFVARVKGWTINNKYKDAPRIKVTVEASDGTTFISTQS